MQFYSFRVPARSSVAKDTALQILNGIPLKKVINEDNQNNSKLWLQSILKPLVQNMPKVSFADSIELQMYREQLAASIKKIIQEYTKAAITPKSETTESIKASASIPLFVSFYQGFIEGNGLDKHQEIATLRSFIPDEFLLEYIRETQAALIDDSERIDFSDPIFNEAAKNILSSMKEFLLPPVQS